MKHLEPYGYDENNKLSPYKCCDCDINIHIDNNDEKDTEQDREIGKKANTSDVQSAFTIVSDAINRNTANINELSGKVDTLRNDFTSAVTENAAINERQDAQIDALSAKTASFIAYSDIDSVKSAITEDLKEEFYTKCESDERFISSADCLNLISGKADSETVNTLINTVQQNVANAFGISNAAIATNQKDIDSIKHILGTSSSEPSIKTQIDGNHAAIEAILTEHIPELQNSIDKKADNENVLNIVDTINKTIANTTNILIGAIHGNQENIDLIKHILGTSSSEPSIKTQIDGNHAAIEAIIKEDLPNAVAELTDKINLKADKAAMDEALAKKADKTEVEDLSATVKSFDTYIKQVANDKADKKDLDDLKGKVNDLTDSDNEKASKADLNAVSAVVSTNKENIQLLDINKQDKGDYVSATTLDNYYTKAETYSKEEADAKLSERQPKGDYVSAVTLNNYYTKDQTVDKTSYDEFVDSVNSKTKTFADKDLVNSMNSRLGTVEKSANSLNEDLSTLKTEIVSDYATKQEVSDDIKDINSAITYNNSLIAKISEVTNLDKYNPTTGEFDDSGNGVLDVLHREFHNLTKGYSEDSLVGLIKALENKITALEIKLKSFEGNLTVLPSGDVIVSGNVDRSENGRTLTLVQEDGDKLDIPLNDVFKKENNEIEILSDGDKLYLSENGKKLNASELLYMLQNDTY
jgi:hypothetical protein